MAAKKRKTAKRKTAHKSTARRGGGGPLKALSGKVTSLGSRVEYLEKHAIIAKKKHAAKRFAGTDEEVY
jgi:hypothetical protein